jgi:hypothetical protein
VDRFEPTGVVSGCGISAWRRSHQDEALHHQTVLVMTAPTFRTLAVAALVVTQGCFFPMGHGARPEIITKRTRGGASAPNRLTGNGFGPKNVQGKQPPTRLVARDGTTCVVTRDKFESTTLGTSVWCAWMDTNR